MLSWQGQKIGMMRYMISIHNYPFNMNLHSFATQLFFLQENMVSQHDYTVDVRSSADQLNVGRTDAFQKPVL